jgi:hypothetical protein
MLQAQDRDFNANVRSDGGVKPPVQRGHKLKPVLLEAGCGRSTRDRRHPEGLRYRCRISVACGIAAGIKASATFRNQRLAIRNGSGYLQRWRLFLFLLGYPLGGAGFQHVQGEGATI